MSDKFDMKLVIDAVTTPLLHARLGKATSFRERAALLRSLAESALRGDYATRLNSVAVDAHEAGSRELLTPHINPFSNGQRSEGSTDIQAVASGYVITLEANEAQALERHDVDQIADAFGSFF